ncbi:hypothetical protein L1049_010492 [Liquidambar formosana]|uniref:Uncharacterized protein n=1 Tax=Liquidambar formosana TaxID=63359 RepID=A0AAP0N7N2_LIQFO
MAFYSANFHKTDLPEYGLEPNPYGYSYDFPPTQASIAYSSYDDFSGPKFIEYDQAPYYGAYDPASTRSVISYSTASTFSEPNVVQYNPSYGFAYNPSQTHFLISYSASNYTEPDEFIDDDPTPYVGGYDITLTYGKPLPPSDETCYPRSVVDPNYGAIVLPQGADEVDEQKVKPRDAIKPIRANEVEQHGYDNGPGSRSPPGEPVDSNQGEERAGTFCDDYYPWTDYEYDKQVPHTPCGYGSDALDLC